MKNLLREVFAHASRGLHHINNTVDYTGFLLWRAMTDETFLSAAPLHNQTPMLRTAIETYDRAKERAQHYIYKDLLNKGVTGNVGPKPNYKPILFKALETASPYIARMNLGSPAVTAFAVAAMAIGAYTVSHNGSNHIITDMVASWYGMNSPRAYAPDPY